MKDDRYQFQPWYIKAFRQIRYKPQMYALMAWHFMLWIVVHRMCIPTEPPNFYKSRWHVAKHAYRCWLGLCHCWMGNTLTLDEAMDKLRKRSP